LKVVRREHNPPWIPRDEIGEPGSPLDIHVFRTAVQRLAQNGVAPLLASIEAAAFPGRSAGDDHRPRPPGEGTGHIDVLHTVQTEFDHVAARGRVTRNSQIGHRLASHGFD
jgi:hypothetical protein